MRISEKNRVDILRQKAEVLESENVRLSKRVSELQRENLALKGLSPEAIELNLPELLDDVTKQKAGRLTRSGSEGRQRSKEKKPKKKQVGHGPTPQPKLEIVDETYDLDEADKACTECGGELKEFIADETQTVSYIERKWVIKRNKLKKYRCKCGGCVQTAEGPSKLLKGGRYEPDVAIAAVVGKHLDHIPLSRQVRMAKRQGLNITSQTLWDQAWALCELLMPLCERIRQHILHQNIAGVDGSSFKLIEKGGTASCQVWQLSCANAAYFEILPSKEAVLGKELFLIRNDEDEVIKSFSGIVVADGAAELEAISKMIGFCIAACWSHARRHVLRAEKEAPAQVAEFLDLVEQLYAVDKKAARDPPDDDTRRGYRHLLDMEMLRELRDGESRKICSTIHEWILAQSCVPGGLLKAALKYIAARWTNLLRFLDDPHIPLDNNQVERGFIGLAIGRRNYIGARSWRGNQAAGCFYTVTESARINGVCAEEYLRYATITMLRGDTPLLPHQWAITT